MIETTNKFTLREYPRYRTRDAKSMTITIDPSDGGESQHLPVELLDLSRNGVKLTIAQPLAVTGLVRVRIQAAEAELDLIVSAELCWTEPCGPGVWALGCRFVADLPYNVLPWLAKVGYIERRTELRRAISLPARAKRELAEAEEFEVRLEDYSTGGFRMFSPQPCKVGERLLVRLTGTDGRPIELSVKAQWQLVVTDGVYTGCSFLNKNGYVQLTDSLQHRADALKTTAIQPAGVRRPFRLSRWGWLGLFAALTWLGSRAILAVLT